MYIVSSSKNEDTLNPFPHTTNLQQTTLKTSGQNYGNSMNERPIIENQMSNFFFLPLCFQKSSAAEALESVYMWERVKNLALS